MMNSHEDLQQIAGCYIGNIKIIHILDLNEATMEFKAGTVNYFKEIKSKPTH